MAESQVLIVSSDRDFADMLAEHVAGELKVPCKFVSKNDLKQLLGSALAVVSTEDLSEESLPCGLVFVKDRPVKLRKVLDDIARAMQNQKPEEVKLGGGFTLQARQKLLSNSGRSVQLTDKEISLLQSLIDAKGQVAHKDQLLKTVWGFDEAVDTHTLETHIYRLRGKFRELAETETITATEGGYSLVLK